MAPVDLRYLIDLIEAQQPWTVSVSSLFEETLRDNLKTFPDLREKVSKFVAVKLENPLSARYGKHDRPFTGPLVGFWHAHLRDDAIIIYNLKNRSLQLIAIVTHAEIEGKRTKSVIKKIEPFR